METFFLTDLFQDFVLFRSEVVHTGCSENITLFLLDRDLQIEQVFVLEVYYQHIKEVTVRRCEVTERLYYQQVFQSYINCGTTLSVTVWT